MNVELQKLCDLFVENKTMIKAGFPWSSGLMAPVCASILAQKKMLADTDRIKECKMLIKEKTGMFSQFRNTAVLALATMLSMEEDPAKRLDEVLEVYDELRKEFHSSAYLPMTAYFLATSCKEDEIVQVTNKASNLYQIMKSRHPFLTSSEDCAMIAMLALSDEDEYDLADHVEECYRILKPEFFSSNAVQALSLTLALGDGDAQEKCMRAMDIFNILRNQGCKFGTGMELATLGVLALTEDSVDQMTSDIIEVEQYLKTQKGFGALSMGRGQRVMFAAMLSVMESCDPQNSKRMNTAAANSITSIIIAQQIAACAAASAAAASASSGGN